VKGLGFCVQGVRFRVYILLLLPLCLHLVDECAQSLRSEDGAAFRGG